LRPAAVHHATRASTAQRVEATFRGWAWLEVRAWKEAGQVRTKAGKWRRWTKWIGRELERLESWRAARAGLDSDDRIAPPDRAFVGEVYAHALAMGVRRQLKTGSRDVSLMRLLEDIAANPGTLAPGPGGRQPTRASVRRDIAALKRLARPAESFADRSVAHSDRRSGGDPPIDALHAVLDRLHELHASYARLIPGRPAAGPAGGR
ncbi:MAG: hypothetical protein PVH00_05870, partial [Gemmatimonadota bacterium]